MSQGPIKPFIVPIFLPNLACPHMCIFCEQERITSQSKRHVNGVFVADTLKQAIQSKRFPKHGKSEVAFYGGTFSNLTVYKMRELLDAVDPFIKEGFFNSVRISTRPDALDETRLEIMKKFNVTIVELGAQSMDDNVLSLSQRGHTSEDTKRAVYDLKRHGFKVGMQLMPGLPGDSKDIFNKSITEVIALHPDMVRLYPVVVIRGTELARQYGHGMYRPLKLKEAIEICVNSCIRLEGNGLPVIRVGLMSSPTLLEGGQILAGPWHPAFGFLVRSEIYKKGVEKYLSELGSISTLRIRAPSKEISLLRGYKNRGIQSIKQMTGAKVIDIEPDDSVADGVIKVYTL